MQLLTILIFFVSLFTGDPLQDSPQKEASAVDSLRLSCKDFNVLNTRVRDGSIARSEAEAQFKHLLPLIRRHYQAQQKTRYLAPGWVFPIRGYTPQQIGGKNGSGYVPGGYSYFDGNKHRGHPAHDIFIYDKNQDNLDDRTRQPVDILSVSGGVVVAAETAWTTDSQLRGGNYIWIYDPDSDGLFYYAHNNRVIVQPGDGVTPGQKIGEAGRSGLNAFKQRSPTHLHLMYLEIAKGLPVAKDVYKELVKARLVK